MSFAIVESASARSDTMTDPHSTMARELAQVACAFERRRTGRTPQAVTVVMAEDVVVVTLYGALSPAEIALAKNPVGAAQLQQLHRHLFANSADEMRQEIRRITGVDVREASAHIEPGASVVQVFANGAIVQTFLLAQGVPIGSYSGSGTDDPR
jgi:uncharacterized protein YbcI